MFKIRKSDDRGATKIDWLDSKHTFSFGHYNDFNYMGFGVLRVINEDKVKPSCGFGAHPHSNMEIISYVLEGSLSHKDSLGTGSIIVPGDVQRMSAGTGITHSEFNPEDDNPVHFLQIWIVPENDDISPSYEQKNFTEYRKTGQLTLLASRDGRNGSLAVHQDISLYVLDLGSGQTYTHPILGGRMVWVQVARGGVILNGHPLKQGDGAAISDEESLAFSADEQSEVLIFDLSHL
jgi:redox-sensitive bicupin YhaK (pirin superfamily)